jgi:hypothetical protein
MLPLCLQLLGESSPTPAKAGEKADLSPRPLWTCSQCGGPMVLIERLSPADLLLHMNGLSHLVEVTRPAPANLLISNYYDRAA